MSTGTPSRSVAQAILELLWREGVRVCFAAPDAGGMFPQEALPRVITLPSAASAVHAADALARATGALSVALISDGMATLESLPAFAAAKSARSPLVVIGIRQTARVGLAEPTPLVAPAQIFEGIAAPWLAATDEQEALAMTLAAAVTAKRHPREPVYLMIESNLLPEIWGEVPLPSLPDPLPPHPYLHPPVPSHADLANLLGVLSHHERIAFWVGGGAVAAGIGRTLEALAERLGAVVIPTRSARGLIRNSLVLDLPTDEPEVRHVIDAADLVIAWGTDARGKSSEPLHDAPGFRVVIGLPEAQFSGGAWDLVLATELAVTAELTLAAVEARDITRVAWASNAPGMKARAFARLADDSNRAELRAVVDDVWPSEAAILLASDDVGEYFSRYLEAKRPRRLAHTAWPLPTFVTGALGPASVGIPNLVLGGPQMPWRTVMAAAEGQGTSARGLGIVVVVIDDGPGDTRRPLDGMPRGSAYSTDTAGFRTCLTEAWGRASQGQPTLVYVGVDDLNEES